jgi:hypothetical protein
LQFYLDKSDANQIMLKSQKSQFTCSYCYKIFKEPILLPCEDSICREHLAEREVVKQNKIKCNKCNEEFGVKNNEFKSNDALKNSIESQSYLNQEEISLKQELEETIRKFFEFYDEFIQNRTKLDLDVFNHFHEMRFKIDEQREELKRRIDDIALVMIEKIKKNEAKYLQDLKEHFSSFDGMQSLEDKLNEIEAKFRQPNLLIQTIQDMQKKQEESLKDIQLKLNLMSLVKDDLIATNDFKPTLSSFNQNEETTSLFGSIKLNQFTSINVFESEILKGEQQLSELIKLCEYDVLVGIRRLVGNHQLDLYGNQMQMHLYLV